MEATHCQRCPLLCLGAIGVLIAAAGCSRPDFVFSVNSAADAANQRFEESLIGTWAACTSDEPYMLVTVARAAEDSRDYVVRMNDPEDPDGLEDQWSGRMRLIRIGEFEFIELKSTVPKDLPAEERMTVDGEPLWNTYSLWRITHEADSVHVWGFKDRRILKQLPESEIVPAIPQGRNITIANSPASELQQFLAKHGAKMTRNSENFRRYDQAAND